MKKPKSIFVELLVNILLPVFIILIIFSSINYYINKQKLQESYLKEREQVTSEVKSILHMYDQALLLLEDEIDKEIKRIAYALKNNYFNTSDSIATANLDRISLEINLDTANFDIYMINQDLIIDNTTYAKDDKLDFKKINGDLVKFLHSIFKKDSLLIDRFGGEMSTKKIKKYAYLTTSDKKYIMEFGAYSPKANLLEDKVYEEIKKLKNNFPELNEIKFYVATENTEYENIPKGQKKYQLEALRNQKSVRATEKIDGVTWYYDYIYIKMPGATLYSGYMLLIVSNDTREKKLLANELIRFSWMTLGTLLPLSLILFFRSRKIIRPIKNLNEKAMIISKGKLDERVPVEGSAEIVALSGSFNKMVDELQESYNTLEQKVIERTLELRHQKEIVEEKHKEITDSINYAERIQRSFLATKELLDEHLSHSGGGEEGKYFVFFKPKDVVSGDFYWASKLNNGNFALVCADSTGHGVPGAIMSILNISSLEKAIETNTQPNKILFETRKIIINRLKKDGSKEGGKDGMDASLLVLNPEKNKLTFASAHNPVILIRQQEIIEFKGDKMPVGKHDRDNEPFTLQEIDLIKGDIIYILTDGFPDQFGGEKSKKYMIKNLKNYFLSIAHLPMKEQEKKLAIELENWKGSNEQIDDICIIGVKIS